MWVSFTVKVSVRVIQVAILSCNCEATQPRHEGEEQGRKYFCHSFCHFCWGEMAELLIT